MDDISRRVIGGAFTVLTAAGSGVLDNVQENALAHERRKAGLAAEQQRGLTITYVCIVVGEDLADPIVERVLLVELKAMNAANEAHHAQCIDYFKAFGPRPGSLFVVRLRYETAGNQARGQYRVNRSISAICGIALLICVRFLLARESPHHPMPRAIPPPTCAPQPIRPPRDWITTSCARHDDERPAISAKRLVYFAAAP